MKEQPTQRAVIECGHWLAKCLEYGWLKSELNFLESLWWKYHDRNGYLVDESQAVGAVDPHAGESNV